MCSSVNNDQRSECSGCGLQKNTPSVDIGLLPPGTRLAIGTKNSTYHVTLCDPSHRTAVIEGGRLFQKATGAQIEGATPGTGPARLGHIEVGASLELLATGRRIVTSRVHSIECLSQPVTS